MCVCVYVCVCVCTRAHTHTHIYISGEREREREREIIQSVINHGQYMDRLSHESGWSDDVLQLIKFQPSCGDVAIANIWEF